MDFLRAQKAFSITNYLIWLAKSIYEFHEKIFSVSSPVCIKETKAFVQQISAQAKKKIS